VPNQSSRAVFTAAVLLLLVAGLQAWVAYSGADLTIGVYAVPGVMSWVAAGIFGLVGILAMRAAHAGGSTPVKIAT
jgi:hypothetical protein